MVYCGVPETTPHVRGAILSLGSPPCKKLRGVHLAKHARCTRMVKCHSQRNVFGYFLVAFFLFKYMNMCLFGGLGETELACLSLHLISNLLRERIPHEKKKKFIFVSFFLRCSINILMSLESLKTENEKKSKKGFPFFLFIALLYIYLKSRRCTDALSNLSFLFFPVGDDKWCER